MPRGPRANIGRRTRHASQQNVYSQNLSEKRQNIIRENARLRQRVSTRRSLASYNRLAFQYDPTANYSDDDNLDIRPMTTVRQYCNALKFKRETAGLCCGPTSPDTSNLPAVKIEISPTQVIEYNGPQAIGTEEENRASMEIPVLTSNDNNLEESNSSNLEVFADETMETIYLSSSDDNEAADQSTMHKKYDMNSDTGKLLSMRREPEAFEKNYIKDVSYEGVRIKTEPQMLEEEHIEWNAVKTHPQAIKVESIEIKTEPHHMLESDQVEDNPGNCVAIEREIITRDNDDREKRTEEQRVFLLNQNSIDSCPPCSDIIVPAESLGNFKSILLLDSSETVENEEDIHCDQQLSPSNLPRTKEACGHDFVTDDIDTLEEAMKLLEMLEIYAATTENCRAMIVLSQLEEALKEESN